MTTEGKRGYQVFNETDGVFASPQTFKTIPQAEEYAKKFRERFAAQGYYLTARGERLAARDVRLVARPVNS